MDKNVANCGIYEIRIDRPNGTSKYYIGQSTKIHQRHLSHLSSLRRGSHKNIALARAYEKYGSNAFHFRTVLICKPEKNELAMYEQAILDFYRSTYGDDVLNLCIECVTSILGTKRSKEVIEKTASKNRGKKMTPEHKSKMIAGKKASGWSPTAEHRAKVAAAAIGRKHSEETKRICADVNIGTKKSPEEIARRQAKRMENGGYVVTAETVEKRRKTLFANRAARAVLGE